MLKEQKLQGLSNYKHSVGVARRLSVASLLTLLILHSCSDGKINLNQMTAGPIDSSLIQWKEPQHRVEVDSDKSSPSDSQPNGSSIAPIDNAALMLGGDESNHLDSDRYFLAGDYRTFNGWGAEWYKNGRNGLWMYAKDCAGKIQAFSWSGQTNACDQTKVLSFITIKSGKFGFESPHFTVNLDLLRNSVASQMLAHFTYEANAELSYDWIQKSNSPIRNVLSVQQEFWLNSKLGWQFIAPSGVYSMRNGNPILIIGLNDPLLSDNSNPYSASIAFLLSRHNKFKAAGPVKIKDTTFLNNSLRNQAFYASDATSAAQTSGYKCQNTQLELVPCSTLGLNFVVRLAGQNIQFTDKVQNLYRLTVETTPLSPYDGKITDADGVTIFDAVDFRDSITLTRNPTNLYIIPSTLIPSSSTVGRLGKCYIANGGCLIKIDSGISKETFEVSAPNFKRSITLAFQNYSGNLIYSNESKLRKITYRSAASDSMTLNSKPCTDMSLADLSTDSLLPIDYKSAVAYDYAGYRYCMPSVEAVATMIQTSNASDFFVDDSNAINIKNLTVAAGSTQLTISLKPSNDDISHFIKLAINLKDASGAKAIAVNKGFDFAWLQSKAGGAIKVIDYRSAIPPFATRLPGFGGHYYNDGIRNSPGQYWFYTKLGWVAYNGKKWGVLFGGSKFLVTETLVEYENSQKNENLDTIGLWLGKEFPTTPFILNATIKLNDESQIEASGSIQTLPLRMYVRNYSMVDKIEYRTDQSQTWSSCLNQVVTTPSYPNVVNGPKEVSFKLVSCLVKKDSTSMQDVFDVRVTSKSGEVYSFSTIAQSYQSNAKIFKIGDKPYVMLHRAPYWSNVDISIGGNPCLPFKMKSTTLSDLEYGCLAEKPSSDNLFRVFRNGRIVEERPALLDLNYYNQSWITGSADVERLGQSLVKIPFSERSRSFPGLIPLGLRFNVKKVTIDDLDCPVIRNEFIFKNGSPASLPPGSALTEYCDPKASGIHQRNITIKPNQTMIGNYSTAVIDYINDESDSYINLEISYSRLFALSSQVYPTETNFVNKIVQNKTQSTITFESYYNEFGETHSCDLVCGYADLPKIEYDETLNSETACHDFAEKRISDDQTSQSGGLLPYHPNFWFVGSKPGSIGCMGSTKLSRYYSLNGYINYFIIEYGYQSDAVKDGFTLRRPALFENGYTSMYQNENRYRNVCTCRLKP
jgi:hypothetical protein